MIMTKAGNPVHAMLPPFPYLQTRLPRMRRRMFGLFQGTASYTSDGAGLAPRSPNTASIQGMTSMAGRVYVYAGGPEVGTTPAFTVDGGWALNCDGTWTVMTDE